MSLPASMPSPSRGKSRNRDDENCPKLFPAVEGENELSQLEPMSLSALSVDQIFRALSSRIRLRILNLLDHRDLCICDLTNVFELSPASLSRHLGYLRRNGFIAVRKEEGRNYYRRIPVQNDLDDKLRQCFLCCQEVRSWLTADLAKLNQQPDSHGLLPCAENASDSP